MTNRQRASALAFLLLPLPLMGALAGPNPADEGKITAAYCRLQETAMRALTLDRLNRAMSPH